MSHLRDATCLPRIRDRLAEHGIVCSGQELGEGGHALVEQGMLGPTPCAVKISLKSIEDSPDTRHEFERGPEIWPLTRAHDGLLRFFQHFKVPVTTDAGERHHLVTVWQLAHDCLAKHVGQISAAELCERLAPIADAIDFLNAQRVFHRDVKPGNILILDDGTYRIADLGSAKTVINPTLSTESIAGTMGYGPPEMITESACHPTNDLYCLASTIVVMLKGHWHFGGVWPTLDGDSFVLRLRDRVNIVRTLETLAFGGQVLELLAAAVDPDRTRRPRGGALAWLKKLQSAIGGTSTAIPPPRSGHDTGDWPGDSGVATDAALEARLISLGLNQANLEQLVRTSIGVSWNSLPHRIVASLTTVGAYRAKEVAFELLQSVRRLNQTIQDMRIRLENPEPLDTAWLLIKYEYETIATHRQLLGKRIDKDCDLWRRYTVTVVPIYHALEHFSGDCLKITQGYIPKSMRKADDPAFQPLPSLMSLADRIDYYHKAIDRLAAEFPSWELECEQLYNEHCRLLEL